MSIEPLDYTQPADVAAVAELHRVYLPESPVVKFGRRFLCQFYYRDVVKDGLIGCLVCRVEGRVVGFLSFTAQPNEFMSLALRKHWFSLMWALGLGFLERPAMLKDVWMVLRVMRARGGHLSGTEPPGLGEALSMAVLPEFETYVPPGGRSRVSMRLFQVAVEKMQRQGVNRVQLMVQPSNLAANLFYSSLGCTMEKTEHAGYAVHRYIYEVPPAR